MKLFIAFLLLLAGCRPMDTAAAPAPREAKPVVTEWTLQIQSQPGNAWNQETTFRSDGTCESPQYGKGTWRADGDMIHFGEFDDKSRYVLVIDWESMSASGHYTSNGRPGGNVQLTLKLGPKEVD